ncbi:Arginine pathway regulatory protein ArgR, repressor of arg regulon [Oxalobacteraceae bacterium IMCC9480]|nr:Arginine pathway regulatory protein ArgR, repressor of arg regulon [Oxalobacteraceae bacterium IMCC9480]NDP59397.1 helix-turn-helix domain-containing protein [Oxalobacteraceae bacterium]
MPLSHLALQSPLRIQLITIGDPHSITLAGLVQPLRLAGQLLGAARLQLTITGPDSISAAADLSLLVADDVPVAPANLRELIATCRQSACWGAVGTAVLWLVRAGALDGVRAALPWALYPALLGDDDDAERAILTPHLYECDGPVLTCCGGAASIDFALTLIEQIWGAALAAQLREALCIERVRAPAERQRQALQARFGMLQPKLSEAVALMEANLEEPLGADDIASLVGLSRRQLDRLFKQHLASMPSRYYLDLRLQQARRLLLESNQSIVQVGLLCGFSSGSHFSTAYGTLFGITPREQRQRRG